MTRKKRILLFGSLLLVAVAVIVVFFVPITLAQKHGPPKLGAPAFTAAARMNVLPPVPPKFGGVIKTSYKDSKPWWPPTIVPPKGAPNVLLIMLDDAGYGAESTFGGVIPTPTMDRLASMGLRYTMFHSASLCSPTRAALITGRNHHSVHFGVVAEASTGYPGYDAIIDKSTATIGEILKQHGYWTSWFGKDHNVPSWMQTQAGRSISGRTGWGSNTSTASSAATRASGRRTCFATRRRSRPTRATRSGT